MEKEDIHIPGVGNEAIVLITRKHWASMIGVIVLIAAMVILPTVLLVIFKFSMPSFLTGWARNVVVLMGSIYFLVVVTVAFFEWVNFYYDLFIFTEDEIIDIKQNGFFNRYITQISLKNVQDVSAHIKGMWPSLFGYGDVVAETAGDKTQTYVIQSIPNPMDVADKILEIHNQMRIRELRGEGLIKTPEPVKDNNVCLPCPPNDSTSSIQPKIESKEIEISKDDLNKGGEIRL